MTAAAAARAAVDGREELHKAAGGHAAVAQGSRVRVPVSAGGGLLRGAVPELLRRVRARQASRPE